MSETNLSVLTGTRTGFVGFRPYAFVDAENFPARQRPIEELLGLLPQRKFIGVIGPEGSGKTSLVEAGLFSALQRGFNGLAGRSWAICSCRPGVSPIKNLAFALGANGVLEEGQRTTPEMGRRIEALIRDSNTGVVEAYRRSTIFGRKNLLIFVDQLEDFFVYPQQEEYGNGENQFLANLSRAAGAADVPIYVVVALRSAYISELHVFGRFQQELNAGQYIVPPFRPADFSVLLDRAFTGLDFSAKQEVSKNIQEEFGSEMRHLPELQFLLWKSVEGSSLTNEGETQPTQDLLGGGLTQIFHKDLENKFLELSPEDQVLMEKLFRALFSIGSAGAEVQPKTFSMLCDMTEAEPEQLKRLMLTLTQPDCRYLEVMPAFLAPGAPFPRRHIEPGDLIGVTNHAILRHWERLEHWMQAEEHSRETYLRLVQDALRFRRGDTGYLPPLDLELALQWKEQQAPTAAWAGRYHPDFELAMTYLSESEEARKEEIATKERLQKEKLRRWRIMALIIMGISFAVILIIAAFYFDAKNEQQKAKEAEKLAKEAENIAKKALINEQAETQRADSLFKIALSEAETTRRALSKEKEATQKADKERRRAESAFAETRQALAKEEKARQEAQRATENEKAANEQVRKALSAEERATELANSRKQLAELEKEFFELENELKQANDASQVLPQIIKAYEDYLDISNRIHGRVVPNNQLQRLLNLAQVKHFDKVDYSETPMRIHKAERGGLRSIAVKTDGTIAAAGDDGMVHQFSKSGVKKWNIAQRIRALYYLDSDRLLAGTFTGSVFLLSGEEARKLIQGGGKPEDRIIAILPGFETNEMLAVSARKIIRIQVNNGKTRDIALDKPVRAAFRHPGIPLPLLSNTEGLWKMDSKGNISPVLDLRNTRYSGDAISALTHFDQWTVIGMRSGRILVFSDDALISGKATADAPVYSFQQHKSEVTSLAADQGRKLLYSASLDNQIKVYDFTLKENIQRYVLTFEGHKKWVWDLKLLQASGQPSLLLTADENGHLLKWNTSWSDILELFNYQKDK